MEMCRTGRMGRACGTSSSQVGGCVGEQKEEGWEGEQMEEVSVAREERVGGRQTPGQQELGAPY